MQPSSGARRVDHRQITRVAYDRLANLLYAWNRCKGHW
jgi:predicted DCC family thiol-disulfide oxidoreductase YuxK